MKHVFDYNLHFLLVTAFVVVGANAILKNNKLWTTSGDLMDSIVGPNELPFMLSLRYNSKHVCGAVLLREDYALTTASCVGFGVKPYYSVVAGEHEFGFDDETEQYRSIVNVTVHPLFNASSHEYDIALLKILPAFTLNPYVDAIELPDVDFNFTGRIGIVSGWGYTQEAEGKMSELLRSVTVPILSDHECRALYPRGFINEAMACAGIQEGGRDFCQGDVGGPLLWKNPVGNSSSVLVGLASWNYGCGRPGYPGIYTEVKRYVGWIVNSMIIG